MLDYLQILLDHEASHYTYTFLVIYQKQIGGQEVWAKVKRHNRSLT